MELVRQSVHVLSMPTNLQLIEAAGRTCYKSEEKNPDFDPDITNKFIAGIIYRGHMSVIEHAHASVRFITNRGTSHELVRHRLAEYSQESTRYSNYGNKHVKFVIPHWAKNLRVGIEEYNDLRCEQDEDSKMLVLPDGLQITPNELTWLEAMCHSEESYQMMIGEGLPAQDARGVLPIDLKTEIVMTANFREWLHIFSLRCSKAAHPQIRQLMMTALDYFAVCHPVVFGDLFNKLNKGE